MPKYKIARIASDIQRYLGEILINEVNDEILKSITITEVALDKKAIIDKLFNNRVNTKAKKSKPNELFPNFEDLLNIGLSFFKKSAEDDVKGVFIMKKDDTEVGLF